MGLSAVAAVCLASVGFGYIAFCFCFGSHRPSFFILFCCYFLGVSCTGLAYTTVKKAW
ncbi:hypothetical protein IWZ01DRAFT_194126 [Phyllosticta capitalensis]